VKAKTRSDIHLENLKNEVDAQLSTLKRINTQKIEKLEKDTTDFEEKTKIEN